MSRLMRWLVRVPVAAVLFLLPMAAQAQGGQQGSNVTNDMGPRTNITGGAG